MSGSNLPQATPSSRDNSGNKAANASPSASPGKATVRKPLARAAKNQKEIVIEIAALTGKGYPAPVDLDTGASKGKR
jgi:hypothetical protein